MLLSLPLHLRDREQEAVHSLIRKGMSEEEEWPRYPTLGKGHRSGVCSGKMKSVQCHPNSFFIPEG